MRLRRAPVSLSPDRTHRRRGEEVGGVRRFTAGRVWRGPVRTDSAMPLRGEPCHADLYATLARAGTTDTPSNDGGLERTGQSVLADRLRSLIVSEHLAPDTLAPVFVSSSRDSNPPSGPIGAEFPVRRERSSPGRPKPEAPQSGHMGGAPGETENGM
jgi:hypothetical protein